VASLQIMLDKGKELDWFSSPLIIGLAVVALIGFCAFLIWELTAEHLFELAYPQIRPAIRPGEFIVAGKNFGCGSSREQAVSTLKGHELNIIANTLATK